MSNPPLTPHEIAAQIRPALTKLYVRYSRTSQQSDLTGPQLSMMERLREEGEARVSQLAKDEGIRMPTASNALHLLEQRGIVERLRDTADRRGVRVRLTSKGLSELNRVGNERVEQLAELITALPQDLYKDAEAAIRCINAIAANYGKSTPAN
ncbi:MarR family winged helix-turn-helix transcriptional regulator [Corynebacterium caspium]|uniref:MarR family winged helix-turn-helix transcriptional regulator n=1 Tax=Corynebacterium caspium TaxID=234828 RepID=UPI0003722265|nr:MarR family transcriptional regulator [Corynebacterium caspium]WKD60031.1 transcriptional regulator SlyA [Corynebacterium caspium DSM 44850]